MRKSIIVIGLVLTLFFVVVICIKPALKAVTEKGLQRAIPGSRVTILRCDLGLDQVRFYDVQIHQPNVFDIKARQVVIQFTLGSLLKGNIPVITVTDATFIYKKMKIENIQADGWLKGQEYFMRARLVHVVIADMVKAFKLHKKLDWQGSLDGELMVSGDAKKIRTLNGNLTTGDQGGLLVIKDTRFLANMARNAKLPVNIVVDSFKNYHYDNGLVKLSLEQENILVLDMSLQGKVGKRNVKINLHNFEKDRL